MTSEVNADVQLNVNINHKPPTMIMRFSALVFDSVILLLIGLITGGFISDLQIRDDLPFYALAFSVPFLFQTFLETFFNTSPGKKVAGYTLEIEQPQPMAFIALFIRNAIKFISLLSFLYISVIAVFDLSSLTQDLNEPLTQIALLGTLVMVISLILMFNGQSALHDILAKANLTAIPDFKSSRLLPYFMLLIVMGVLVAIALPNFIGTCGRSKISSVKANMHTTQTMLETYAVDWGGIYPPNMEALYEEANQPGRAYWKEFSNPFLGYSGAGKSYTDEGKKTEPGIVTYEPVGNPITTYYIYGYNKGGTKTQQKGQNFYLTNS